MKEIIRWPTTVVFLLSFNRFITCRRINDNNYLEDQFDRQINYLINQQRSKFSHPQPTEDPSWPITPLNLGQVSGVAVDLKGNAVVFHRGDHVWDYDSFNSSNHYQFIERGPISNDTILTLDKDTGEILQSWGRNRFYLPHGISIDKEGNVWVTDVALHQVFKFPKKSVKPSLVLGKAFSPGSDSHHFCKPTDVAVASNGEFFVSDGYCNSRIIKYSPSGVIQAEWGSSKGHGEFVIAHSLALIEREDLICVADRENKRIVCYTAGLAYNSPGRKIYRIQGKRVGRIFAITPFRDEVLFAVAGASAGLPANGLTVYLPAEKILNSWRPTRGFSQPHDLAASNDGRYLFVSEIGPNRVIKFNIK